MALDTSLTTDLRALSVYAYDVATLDMSPPHSFITASSSDDCCVGFTFILAATATIDGLELMSGGMINLVPGYFSRWCDRLSAFGWVFVVG